MMKIQNLNKEGRESIFCGYSNLATSSRATTHNVVSPASRNNLRGTSVGLSERRLNRDNTLSNYILVA